MEVLMLVHRIPYPPNKGDKIRSYHVLRHLSRHARVHIGTFVDDPGDWAHCDAVRALAGATHFAALTPMRARRRYFSGLFKGEPLSVSCYADEGLAAWVHELLKTRAIDAVLVFSGAMAQFVPERLGDNVRRVVDFVDVDSDKWRQYAASKSWPLNWVFAREARVLLDYEREVALESDASVFVSAQEAELFRSLAPESASRVTHVSNGVDTAYFTPDETFPNPYAAHSAAIAFTGAMDYWANVEAVNWFARDVFPLIRAALPHAEFCIIGARPAKAVQELAALPGVMVSGAVPDVRPYLAHARAVVAPLRIARGVQNKVLEAMAMARPVVATPQALDGLALDVGGEISCESDRRAFAARVTRVLCEGDGGMGARARARVVKDYGWDAHLARLDALLGIDDNSGLHAPLVRTA